ncbi:zinc finger, C2H2 type [Dictyocaulus viviparus]|uniref:Zinc finger, C2H2 type n=1 Tax=Dictyocaulus viviparus TaxID=29172 RepID=A0A0D8Y3X5_DICVI|nr:zinc finger, C2H2 type [Dictyocaulus viviparus]
MTSINGSSSECGPLHKNDSFYSWVQYDGSRVDKVRFICMWNGCKYAMDTKDELAAHFDVHLNYYVTHHQQSSNEKWLCPVDTCRHAAASDLELKRHLAMHQFHAHAQFVGLLLLTTKPAFDNATRCGFPSSLDIVYTGEVTYCLWDRCHHDFSDPLDLFTHVMAHIDFLSSDDKVRDEMFRSLSQYKCLWDQCNRQFESKGDLRKHVRHHSGEKYCACPFCGRFFSRPDKLYEHLRKRATLPENGDNTHLCLLCQRRFGDERSLVNHVRRHINGRQCPTCGLAVPLPSDLHRHILVKHTERLKTLSCGECGKSFYSMIDLVRHSAVHAPPNEVCAICSQRFRWKKQLDKHLLSHSESAKEKPYLCHICDSKYVTGHGLTRHLSRKHECPVPEGFSRFSYKKCADGYFRLQTRKLIRTLSKFILRVKQARFSLYRRYLLSETFSLEKDWAARHMEMTKLGLGSDYEWINAVQKKFIGGVARLISPSIPILSFSAIDVDASVYIAEQEDQVDDVIDIIYKLRHSKNAADLLPSTEYALIRLLLRYRPTLLFRLANDPINHGIFMNEHAACLAIDHFIKQEDFGGASRLSAWVMQQEMTDNKLLNLLVLYSCAKWAELPVEQQTMPCKKSVEQEDNEEDIRIFKFPYLKNPYFDSHFDLVDPHMLAGKTLLWMARDSEFISNHIRQSLMLLGAVLYDRLDIASTLISPSVHGGVVSLISKRLASLQSQDQSVLHNELLNKLGCCKATDDSLSSAVASILENIREEEEEALISKQRVDFERWRQRRQELIKSQADRHLLKIRAGEIAKELDELNYREEKLNFFENRMKWEREAEQNTASIQQSAQGA